MSILEAMRRGARMGGDDQRVVELPLEIEEALLLVQTRSTSRRVETLSLVDS